MSVGVLAGRRRSSFGHSRGTPLLLSVFVGLVAALSCGWLAAASPTASDRVVVVQAVDARELPLVVDAYAFSDLLPDPAGAFTIRDVTQASLPDRFLPNRTRERPLEVGRGAVWVRLRLRSELPEDHTWWVKVGHWGLVELFTDRGSGFDVARSGAFVPLPERASQEVYPGEHLVPLLIPRGRQEITIYLRLSHDLNLEDRSLSPELHRELTRGTARYSKGRLAAHGLLMGALLALAVYHLILFVGVRERVYLYFALALLGRGLMMAAGSFVLFELVWPTAPLWDHAFGLLQVPFWIVPFYLFFMSFLDTRVRAPKTHTLLTVLLLGSLLDPVAALLRPSWFWPVHAAAMVIWAAVPLLVAAASLRKRSREALIFLAANVLMLANLIVQTLRTVGIELSFDLPVFGWYLGILLAAVLFSVAVAEQIRELRREMELAQREEAANAAQRRLMELAAARLAAELGQTRLQAYKNQLQPRFLFASLDGIAALMRSDAALAGRRISWLGDLLRTALQGSASGEVPFSSEVAFASRYVEIERSSTAVKPSVTWEVAPEALPALVLHLLLQPLVEHSLTRGNASGSAPAAVRFDAWVESGLLHVQVRVEGSVPGDCAGGGEGAWLVGTRDRLLGLYGVAAGVELRELGQVGFEVILTLPFRTGELKTQL